MLGVFDRNAGGPVAQTAGPAGDVRDVEHRVAALQHVGLGALGDAVIGAQHQIGHPDVQTLMQRRLPATDGVNPPDRHREAAHRLPLQVVIELPVVLPMQRLSVSTGTGPAHHPGLAHLRDRADCRRGCPGAQDRRAVEIQEWTVEHQSGNAHGRGVPALTHPVQPQRRNQTTGRVAVDDRRRRGI